MTHGNNNGKAETNMMMLFNERAHTLLEDEKSKFLAGAHLNNVHILSV